jgi:hypothetical protein
MVPHSNAGDDVMQGNDANGFNNAPSRSSLSLAAPHRSA